MKAPNKIYVEVCEDGIFAFPKPPFKESVEYIRADLLQREQPKDLKGWLTKRFKLAQKCMVNANKSWNRSYENGKMEAYADTLSFIGETVDWSFKPEQEQPEVDLEKELYDYICSGEYLNTRGNGSLLIARHFYGLRNRALEEAARHVYESWMGGTMDDVRRDMVTLGKVLNTRKEDK